LLGLYEGVALTERDTTYSGFLPDTITIFRGALCDFCSTEEELVHEVAVTVIHEIAHHFGISEHTLHELGWGGTAPTAPRPVRTPAVRDARPTARRTSRLRPA